MSLPVAFIPHDSKEEAWDDGYAAGLNHGRGGARLLGPNGEDLDYNPYRRDRCGQRDPSYLGNRVCPKPKDHRGECFAD